MAEGKKSFLIYCDWISTFEELEDNEAGKLIKHILRYVNDQNPEPENRLLKLVFEPIKQQLKRDLKRYESICERNKKNGENGGRPKKEPKKPSGLNNNPKNPDEPKKPDIYKDSDIDTGIIKNGFKIPEISEIKTYCIERRNSVNPNNFFDFYQSKGWMVGKNKMKDWQAAIRTWEKSEVPKKLDKTDKPLV